MTRKARKSAPHATPPHLTRERDEIFREATKRPVHLRGRFILLVFFGGTLGTATRLGLSLLFPTDGLPTTILAINLAGAFILGVLLESLIRTGQDIGMRRAVRLFIGTGFFGGFTTYSALAVDTVRLAESGEPEISVLYAAGSLVLGTLVAWLGIVCARKARQ